MANGVRINNLNQATSLNDTDTITIIQDDENKKASISLFDKDGTYMQSVVNTIPNLITTSKANVETTKQAIDEKFGYDEFSAQIVTSQAMSSVGVSDDGSVDVSSQVQDGFMESAILKGQTLVNVDSYYSLNDFNSQNIDSIYDDGYIQLTANGTWKNAFTKYNGTLKANTKYLVVVDVKTNTLADGAKPFRLFTGGVNSSGISNVALVNDAQTYIDGGVTGVFKYIVTSASDLSNAEVTLRNYVSNTVTSGIIVYRTMMIEYQSGMENWDILFFRGMQSVKMPILTTTGKNLFNKNNLVLNKGLSSESGAYYNADNRHSTNYIEVEGGKNCCISNMKISLICYYDYDKNFIGHRSSLSHAIPNNAKFLRIAIDNTVNFEQGQLEINSTATSYEPYKTSILSCNEAVELGSVGGIKDELNLLTQQLIQRTDIRPYQEGDESNSKVLTDMTNTRYKLAQEVVKTVDLNSSNGDEKTPVVYKNGHILLQSDGLVPELHYSIPISYSGLIAQNTMTNLKHSWRLDELEIMAYTSIVNSQYESLILVATAETNEVVVSSEYVPDESLYNMLKVLVNANALENADEKINVFYLYGKLSDEMYIDLIMGDDM